MTSEKIIIRILFMGFICWTIVLGSSLAWNISNEKNQAIELATIAARENFNKDQAFRLWGSKHGGIYVPSNERTPPNPALAYLPYRDVETTDGIKLTLMNPAYMLRQMMNEYSELYGIKAKITGEILLNPINAPDEWELMALQKFKNGTTEITAQADIDGKPYLRLMRPMYMKQSCMKCHGHLGFKVGDLRGGVGVAVPLEKYFSNSAKETTVLYVSYLVLWVIGVIALYVFYFFNKQGLVEREKITKIEQDAIQLEKSNQEKSKFLSRMSHELRTPLNSIIGFTQLLQLDSNDSKQQDYFSEILSSSNHLLDLINDVLDLSKIESGHMEISLESVSCNEVIAESINMIQSLITEKNITINFDLEKEYNFKVLADKLRLKQVLINLLSNSIKYNKDNGEVTVEVSSSNNRVMFSISDTGLGLSSAHLDKIFTPFSRFHSELVSEDGTGIGLTISKKIIEDMNGSLCVESELNKGSKFYFELPIALEEIENNDSKGVMSNKIDTTKNELIKEYSIVYIDDNASNLKLVENLIKHKHKNNINVITSLDSTEALTLVKKNKPNLILLDLHMPNPDGYEILKLLQNDTSVSSIPVFAVSASAMETEILQGKNAGFDEYITKPIDVNNFYDKIDNILEKL